MRMMLMIVGGLVAVMVVAGAALYLWGATLPESHTVTVSETVPAAPEQVYDRIRKAGEHTKWRSGLKSVQVVDAERWVEDNDGGKMPLRVLEAAAPSKLVVKIDTEELPFEGVWTYLLRPDTGGTRVEITEQGRVKSAVFRAMGRLFFPPDQTAKTYLADLKRSFGGR
ncbi:MAG: SRPBCC family protein [Bryobacteraceae bacterium]|nr:SRPBCC family protein [Bryobacteraceae bacterium]